MPEQTIGKRLSIVWLDAENYKVRDDGHVKSKAVYSVLGVTMEVDLKSVRYLLWQ